MKAHLTLLCCPMAVLVGLMTPSGPQSLCPMTKSYTWPVYNTILGASCLFLFLCYVCTGFCLQMTSVCTSAESPLRCDGSLRQSNLRGYTYFCPLSAQESQLHFQSKVSLSTHLHLVPIKGKWPWLQHHPICGEQTGSALLHLLLILSLCRSYCTETSRAPYNISCRLLPHWKVRIRHMTSMLGSKHSYPGRLVPIPAVLEVVCYASTLQ